MAPHNLTLTVIGACMLWVGWFGFNAGSALAADGAAGMAMLVTQISNRHRRIGLDVYAEWVKHGKPSVLGIVTGAVAGLVAITPASGSVGPLGALVYRVGFRRNLLLGAQPASSIRLGIRRFAGCLWRTRYRWYCWLLADRHIRRTRIRWDGNGQKYCFTTWQLSLSASS